MSSYTFKKLYLQGSKYSTVKMTTDHHCPGEKGKNPCHPGRDRIKYSAQLSYCGKHQVVCGKHKAKHLKSEKCPKCEVDRECREKELREKQCKEKEEKERKKKELAEKQSERDRAAIAKKQKTIGGKNK